MKIVSLRRQARFLYIGPVSSWLQARVNLGIDTRRLYRLYEALSDNIVRDARRWP